MDASCVTRKVLPHRRTTTYQPREATGRYDTERGRKAEQRKHVMESEPEGPLTDLTMSSALIRPNIEPEILTTEARLIVRHDI